MERKIIALIIAFLLIAGAGALAAIYLIPNPVKPPVADDSGNTDQGIKEVVSGNNKLAFDLFSKLDAQEGNVFFSPYSISSAMAIAYEGSKGKTYDEIKKVFYYPNSDVLAPNFASIYNKINAQNEEYQLNSGNALWVQKDYKLMDNYTSKIESRYAGKAVSLDFINEKDKSASTINSFISDQTNGKIKNIIGPSTINDLTRLIITNAVYFKGDWEWEFDKSETEDRDFSLLSGNKIKVPMMHMINKKADFKYLDNKNLQILELPYKGNSISMLIILPTKDLSSITPLTSEKLDELKSKMEKTIFDDIFLPKFELYYKAMLKDTLKSMGMSLAFAPGEPDFSGIDGSLQLYIDEVIHNAYVKVNEKGTEAAAATSIISGSTDQASTPRKIFNADHPFIFIIQDNSNGNILFMGKVSNPLEK